MTLRTLTLAGECEVRGEIAILANITLPLPVSRMVSTLSKQGGLHETRNVRDNCHLFVDDGAENN